MCACGSWNSKAGLDPDEYCKQHGAEAYHQRIAGAKTYFYWLADRARARFNMREPQGRVDAFQFLLPAIQGLNDKLERVAVANDLAVYLGVESGLVLEHFRKMAADRVERIPAPKTDRLPRHRPHTAAPADQRCRSARATDRSASRSPGTAPTSTAPIFETLISMHDAGEAISFNTLHDAASARSRNFLPPSFSMRTAGAATMEDGLACVDALRREDSAKAIRRELKIRASSRAEREGQVAAKRLSLMRELSQFADIVTYPATTE